MGEERRGVVLIVDDIPTNLEVLMQFLEGAGYEVLVATDGESALEQVEYAAPDVVLLDVMMPGIDGFETCRRLKANPASRDIPVIFMTALSDTVDKVHGFELGAEDYVTKPLQQEEVVARVTAHLTLHRQKQEIQTLRLQERLYYERLAKIKDNILSTASHDLKNPLTSILITIDGIRHYLPKEQEVVHKKLDTLQQEANRMYNLIVQLLDLARLESDIILRKQSLSLYKWLNDNIYYVHPQVDDKQIQIKTELPEQDATVYWDNERMDQVIQNLLSNAVKYTPIGGTVEVSALIQGQDVYIQVSDTGLGIPSNDIPKLFTKFYRVNTRQHMAVSGSGLGLSIVKEIVQKHGGHVWVDSEEGIGSTFGFTIPIGTETTP
ncbi:MAG: response regulator [Chloroflexi bacterium]|nr:response regulator [Chloroflexota bacterium]